MKPVEREFLIKIIEKKIIGEAKGYVCQRCDNYDLEELLNNLGKVFIPQNALDSLQTSLSVICQKKGESAMQYGIRTTELLEDILEAIDRECTPETRYGVKIRAKDSARNYFITGLDNAIEAQVRWENPQDLRKAIELAISEEEHYKLRSRIIGRDNRGIE